EFQKAIGVTGLILTKLDGTAKGGIALAIHHELNIPIRFLGIGEKLTDLVEFEPQEYIRSLLEIE
ncbi:MAG: signal recognition particle-docking protein FtsY, partial [Candidatus Neomarinimicrobiota bacterium]